MTRETLTVRLEAGTRKSLDEIAEVLDRDRSYVVNQALAAYIDLHQWQIGHIKQGLREADTGKFASDAEVEKTLRKLRGK
jgi:predicted transcriptional regulator